MKIKVLFASLALMFSAAVTAEPQLSKDWMWDLSGEEFVYAATINSEGRMLGQYCYFSDSSCVYLVSLGITCREGSEYPSIINSNEGVVDVKLVCGHQYQGENVFYIKPFDDVDNLVRGASNIGFAVAMEEGSFKVVRFSLAGSTYAVEKMRIGAEALHETRSNKNRRRNVEEYL